MQTLDENETATARLASHSLARWRLRLSADRLPMGAIITFDGVFNDIPVEEMQLFDGTVTVTFTDFFGWNNDIDHTPPPGAGALIYGGGSGASVITFSSDVVVPSMFVTAGPFGNPSSTFEALAADGVTVVFSGSTAGTSNGVFNEFGSATPIRSLNFFNYVDSEVDDITVLAVPEPTALALLGAAGVSLLTRRRRCRP